MSEGTSTGLRRPRTLLTIVVVLSVLVLAGLWLHGRFARVGSAYAFVRGDIVLVGAPIEGQLAVIEVSPGDHVRRGQVLARLNDAALRPEVDRARAAFERSRLAVRAERQAIEVERLRIRAERTRLAATVKAAESQSRAATIASRHARRVAERAGKLASRHYVAVAEQDQLTAQADTARAEAARRRADLAQARAEYAALDVAEAELAARVDRVALLEADMARARADLAVAEGRLELSIIRAQHDGRITRRARAPGASIRIGDPVVEMWLDGPVSVEAWMDERDLGRIRLGDPVRVTFEGLHEVQHGRVDSVGMVSDEEVRAVSVTVPVGNRLAKSRWVRVHVALEDPDERLVPGLTAEVRFPGWKTPGQFVGRR